MDERSEAAIARGLREGDVEAWSRLYETYAEKVWRTVCWLIGEDTGHVGDVVQEIFLAAARSARGYDPGRGSLWAWLSGITRRQAALYYRTRSNAKELTRAQEWWRMLDGRQVEVFNAGDLPPADALESAELATLVRHCLAKLPADYQAVLVEKYVEETAVEDIARQFNSSPVAIRSRIARARKAFCRVFRKIAPPAAERGDHAQPQR